MAWKNRKLGTQVGMEKSRSKWLSVAFFLPMILVFMGLVYYLVAFAFHPERENIRATIDSSTIQPAFGRHIILPHGRTQTIGGLQLTFQGIQSDCLLIDVTLPDLDPDYVYHHRVPRQKAEKGFRLAHMNVRMVSAGQSVLKLVPGSGFDTHGAPM